MRLNQLINTSYDIEIKGITDDSRLVKKGFLFVATKGYNVDHYDYVNNAIENGCSFVIVDREIAISFPHLVVENINSLYRELCEKYYNVSSLDFSLIGITGTDGKTTTTTIVSQIIDDMAYLGTNGLCVNKKEFKTNNTTPCVSELYNDLHIIKQNNCKSVVMEVSSEALLHNRVVDFLFDIVGFTNITGDHLNVHKTFENYVDCKMKLLKLVKEDGFVVVNGDDQILKTINCNHLVTFGFDKNNDYVIDDVSYHKRYSEFSLKYNQKTIKIQCPFVGEYNIYNVTMAYIIGLLYGVEESLLLSRISKLKPVKGRGELLDFGQDYTIVLDYAHTTNGILKILETYKDYDKVITVTGCAGGREKEKRSIIGDIVITNSDIAIFTMDDPRYEDVDRIIDDMVGNHKDYVRIPNRVEAIHYALSIATSDSVVLILGKGRDDYMAIEDKKVPYNDYNVIADYFM
ncbi:MAG: UDP-N-acetylmuramoyl-L-alanyl-D-glutamate--2,6-diaminopimelate ligase [Bacilli bacterium]|nr:UDP-N-acetylmuramoyl-L-alanyl-D-glutamate--2,6-diaminopimelate ligase [Bacilli bacterium]